MVTPKPDYRKLIDEAFRDWEATYPTPMTLPVPQSAADDLTGRVMRKLRDAGIVIGLDDGTDYAHRTP